MLERLLGLLSVCCHERGSNVVVGVEVLQGVVEDVVARQVKSTLPFNIAEKTHARLVHTSLRRG